MTRIRNPGVDPTAIADAAALLRAGDVVAFPTETVYGLGAHAFDAAAVARIFDLKGRPADNPCIVHLASYDALGSVASAVPETARRLAETFWPGPLSLVLPKAPAVPKIVTAGLDTVAVRIPDHPVAIGLIEALGAPIAAPSANRSGRPSPTTAADVFADFGVDLPLILDGGPTLFGLESTVVDATATPPRLLRPGGISLEELRAVVGDIAYDAAADAGGRSPGTRHRHYAPRCSVVLAAPGDVDAAIARETVRSGRIGVLRRGDGAPADYVCEAPGDVAAYGRAIFRAFREAEASGVDVLVAETVSEEGLGLAIMDRLRRASDVST